MSLLGNGLLFVLIPGFKLKLGGKGGNLSGGGRGRCPFLCGRCRCGGRGRWPGKGR